ncbi:type II secretion system F family protein [Paenibacillus daejeonensis]|uniref:type II secretion system F family protein n=1 Tax=Paenibacillus daejeonensis TaxID=135193 RepID=UPI0003705B8C|nr:type II secretion system F family protein [Paenibacillus daejeonensis]
MVVAQLAAATLVLLWAAGYGWAFLRQRQISGASRRKRKEPLTWHLTLPWLALAERYNLWEQLQSFLTILHSRLLILNGERHTFDDTKRELALAVSYGYAALTVAALMAWQSEEMMVLVIGSVIAGIIPAAKLRDLKTRIHRRRQQVLLAMPELLSQLMLLIGAGETIQRALLRCQASHVREASAGHPLYAELTRMCHDMHNGVAFHIALEGFNKRCAVQEVSMFTTNLLLNYRRGGDRLRLSLRELSYALWEKRKSVSRTLGEEASSKLVFPLVVIFLILMVIVASPAVLMMS